MHQRSECLVPTVKPSGTSRPPASRQPPCLTSTGAPTWACSLAILGVDGNMPTDATYIPYLVTTTTTKQLR